MLDRRAFLAGAAAGTALLPLMARAQQRRPAKIAYLSQAPENDFRLKDFRDGLRENGLAEGTDVAVSLVYVATLAEFKEAAAQAVAAEPDLIVAVTTDAVVAAAAATKTIPIIGVAMSDPFGPQVVGALGQLGPNVTGLTLMAAGLIETRLRLLRQLVPNADRIGVLFDGRTAAAQPTVNNLVATGQRLDLKISPFETRNAEQLDARIALAAANGVSAVYFAANPVFTGAVRQIGESTLKHKLPAIFDFAEFAEAGGLIAHGPNLDASYRRSGFHVARILKGGKPSEVPSEAPGPFALVVNKKTAGAFGLTVPAEMLAQATRVIE